LINNTGIKRIKMCDSDMAAFYEGRMKLEMQTNQYLFIENEEGRVVHKQRWDGGSFVNIKARTIDNQRFGKIKSLNDEQDALFDLLMNDNITVKLITGKWGSGKSSVAWWWAIDSIDKGKRYNNIVYLRNNIDVKDSMPLGALPSTANEKLKPYAMPIADILGSVTEMERLIEDNVIELVHLGFVRGRNFGSENKGTIILVDECQNLSTEHVALLVSRVGKNSVILFIGDTVQVDKAVFEKNSGMNRLIERLSGNKLFGMVQLAKTERSETSALAELLI
jgi:PhoH-like ATPase